VPPPLEWHRLQPVPPFRVERAPRLLLDSVTATYSSSTASRTHFSNIPPRLMSPLPTNSAGNTRRSLNTSATGSTYFGVAMLPSSTTSVALPNFSATPRASLLSGPRYRSSSRSTRPTAISSRSLTVTTSLGCRNPREGVMTNTPGQFAGGAANLSAYASFPRKYSALIKLNSSPSRTPSARNRTAISVWHSSLSSRCARAPAAFAGESMKIRPPDLRPVNNSPPPGSVSAFGPPPPRKTIFFSVTTLPFYQTFFSNSFQQFQTFLPLNLWFPPSTRFRCMPVIGRQKFDAALSSTEQLRRTWTEPRHQPTRPGKRDGSATGRPALRVVATIAS